MHEWIKCFLLCSRWQGAGGAVQRAALVVGCCLLLASLPARAQRDLSARQSEERLSVVQSNARLHALLAEASGGTGKERRSSRLRRAAALYRKILAAASPGLSPGAADAVRHHVAQAAWLMPDDVFEQAVDGARDENPEDWSFRTGAGEGLLAWWRSRDLSLRTEANERLREHLRRVAHAERTYPSDERFTRFDARGEVYVRYGKPPQRTEVDYNQADFQREVFRFGVPVSAPDFPRNELWLYPELGQSAYYLFIKRGGHYRLARSTNELLPPQLRNNFNRSDRSLNKAVSAMAALRYIYRQLSMFHIDYSGRYANVNDYVLQQEEEARKGEVGLGTRGRQRKIGTGVGSQQVTVTKDPLTGLVLPSRKVRQTLDRSYSADHRAARRRAQSVPRERTDLAGVASPLAVAVRTARFLEDDGATRTEVYWALRPGALRLPEGEREKHGVQYVNRSRPLVSFTALRQNEAYERQKMFHKQYLLRGTTPQAAYRAIPPQQVSFRSTDEVYHLGLQWTHQMVQVREKGERFLPGPLVREQRARHESLRRLSPDETRIEMSDLRPMVLPREAGLQGSNLDEAAVLYPFDQLAPGTPLLLYFEAYHLRYGTDDQTRYTVEYEVQRRTERGGLARLFRSAQERSTATQTTYSSQKRSVEEYILLDLGEWEQGREGQIRIVVRLTDETTGQEVERAVQFEVESRAAE